MAKLKAQPVPAQLGLRALVVSNDEFSMETLSAQAPAVKRQNATAQKAEIKTRTNHPTLVQLRAAHGSSNWNRLSEYVHVALQTRKARDIRILADSKRFIGKQSAEGTASWLDGERHEVFTGNFLPFAKVSLDVAQNKPR
jgi:hypothetical protein